jgi:hypothetical protein
MPVRSKASKLLRCREMSRRAKRSTLHCKKNSDLCRRQTIADTTADPESSKSGNGDLRHFARDDASLSLSCQLSRVA